MAEIQVKAFDVLRRDETRFADPAVYAVERFEWLDDPACEGVVWLTSEVSACDAIRFYPTGPLDRLAVQKEEGFQ